MLFCSLDQSVYELIVFSKEFHPGGAPHIKGVGMLVVSIRCVNFGALDVNKSHGLKTIPEIRYCKNLEGG